MTVQFVVDLLQSASIIIVAASVIVTNLAWRRLYLRLSADVDNQRRR